MSKYTTQPAKAKVDAVKEFAKLIEEYPIVGIVNMESLPTAQLQVIRTKLRGSVLMKMAKTSLLKLALKQSKKPGIHELEPYLKGMPAILFTKDNPFKLYKVIKQNKSRAPAKAGQTANADIVIPAGPTGFAPGPVIGELGALKIKTMVEGGKISIKEPAHVAKEGDVISAPLASMLVRLNIFPMEIGLNVVAVYDAGTIYTKQVLDVDETQIMAQASQFAAEALSLAMAAGIMIKDTVEPLIGKAASEARALAIECNILTEETKDALLAKADAQATALQELTQ